MTVEIIHTDAMRVHGLAIMTGDEVWLTFGHPWWNLQAWLWYWLTPGKKAWVQVNTRKNGRIRVRAVRLAKSHIRAGETIA